MAGKNANKQNQKLKKSSTNKKVGHPWFTLIMSTLGCLALVIGLYYANKANTLKSKELKEGKFTGEQRTKRNVYPTEKPTQSVNEPNFKVREENLTRESKNERKETKKKSKDETSSSKESTAGVQSVKRGTQEKNIHHQKSNDKNVNEITKNNSSGSKLKTTSLRDFKRVPRLDGVKVRKANRLRLTETNKFLHNTISYNVSIVLRNYLVNETSAAKLNSLDKQITKSITIGRQELLM